jgi:hypothetical protein
MITGRKCGWRNTRPRPRNTVTAPLGPRILLKVDGTYFTGNAGGAFEDPLELRNSWNAGVQASLYFGGSTVHAAVTDEHTVPDYSETTATDVKGQNRQRQPVRLLEKRGRRAPSPRRTGPGPA